MNSIYSASEWQLPSLLSFSFISSKTAEKHVGSQEKTAEAKETLFLLVISPTESFAYSHSTYKPIVGVHYSYRVVVWLLSN